MKSLFCLFVCLAIISGCALSNDYIAILDQSQASSRSLQASSLSQQESSLPSMNDSASPDGYSIRTHDTVPLVLLSDSGDSEPTKVSTGDIFHGMKVDKVIYEEILVDGEWKIYQLDVVLSGELEVSGIYHFDEIPYFSCDQSSDLPICAAMRYPTLRLHWLDNSYDPLKKYYEEYLKTKEPMDVRVDRLTINKLYIMALWESDASPLAEVVSMTLAEDE
ncbi:hypothetical protein B5F10_20485 [Anaerotruncus colihominis]|uniref:Lipoprotein n=2 Tax=Anaerotruncus colihominis TaxID=169435 RepID=A0A1Y4MLD6_9FIRM|nr:hypothetical protein [Anaerotruncus colihominis]OUP63611.1 hypothetical protein B5F11_20475 [Anaerotruncus colihominis]OUP68381.1 hypothetical protein B5F10_20485 [Anaerotruncus colihominis]